MPRMKLWNLFARLYSRGKFWKKMKKVKYVSRKRRLEQRIRWRFNNDNRSLAEGEDLLMERLAIEMERDEMRETRAKQKRTKL